MLAGFFRDLPGVGNADNGGGPVAESVDDARTPFNVGKAGIDCILEDLGVGKPELVTARVRGLLIADGVAGGADSVEVGLDLAPFGIAGRGFLFFDTGSAGNGPSGGGKLGGGGREEGRTGIVEVMVAVTELDISMSAESSREFNRSMAFYSPRRILVAIVRKSGGAHERMYLISYIKKACAARGKRNV